MAVGTEFEKELNLLDAIERISPEVIAEVKGSDKVICANFDMYSGFVYRMLGIPNDLFTPLFAVARMAGWSAHRFEELVSGRRIIRPAYKSVVKKKEYVDIERR
jgi:citrate synthase